MKLGRVGGWRAEQANLENIFNSNRVLSKSILFYWLIISNAKQLLFLQLGCSQRSDRRQKLLFLLFSLDKPVRFSPKAFTSLTLFILTHIRKRVLQRLRKGIRNLTLNEKNLESTSNTAGVSQNSLFTSLLWESPGLLLGLCSLLSLPHFTALSLRHCHKRNPPFSLTNIWERNYQHHLLGKQRYRFLHWFEYAKSCGFSPAFLISSCGLKWKFV